MEVLLLKDVPGLGHAGDIKSVAGGYAKNYLLPQKLALVANQGAQKQAESIKQAEQRRKDRKLMEAKGLAAKLEGRVLEFKVLAGEGDRLYGSVTSGDIAEALQRATGLDIERRNIDLEHSLKSLGQHAVQVKVGQGVTATVMVNVEREAGE